MDGSQVILELGFEGHYRKWNQKGKMGLNEMDIIKDQMQPLFPFCVFGENNKAKQKSGTKPNPCEEPYFQTLLYISIISTFFCFPSDFPTCCHPFFLFPKRFLKTLIGG